MPVFILIFLASFAAWALAVLRPGFLPPDAAPLAQAAALLALAGMVLMLLIRPRPPIRRKAGPRRQTPRRGPQVVVDGSNVLFWNDNQPNLSTVNTVVAHLRAAGMEPLVWFDANVGYRVGARWLGPDELAPKLGLPRDQVRVARKGAPADPLLLADATSRGLPVVSNDRYRDWTAEFPIVAEPGRMIRGGMRGGALWLEFPGRARRKAA
ncbi:hypothetical protein [Xinfangfangia pollutisoli]|uniref:hypothetical protein n=1 Tax=Xinfangfangia pollutisoli TaxID=2865960 RepID=UPI001CD81941|nr:hypothetical protein [Xinfangfangia pollutisoli]